MVDELIHCAFEVAAETTKEAGKNVFKDFFTSKEFILGVTGVASTLVSFEINSAVNKEMDRNNMPERMDPKERKSYTLRKKLLNATVDGTTKAVAKTGVRAVMNSLA